MKIHITPQELKIVQNILKKYFDESTKIWVYGSRAKGTAKKYSDLDLAIDTGTMLSALLISEIAYELEESDLPYKVDLVDWTTLSPHFKQRISSDKIELPL